MTRQRDYVAATPDDCDRTIAYCRPGHEQKARALLDRNGHLGARLIASATAPADRILIVDEARRRAAAAEAARRARDEQLHTSRFMPGAIHIMNRSW